MPPFKFTSCLVIVFATSMSAEALTLLEAYSAAARNTAKVAEKQIAEDIAQTKKSQARAAFLPTLTLESSDLWREQANAGAFGEAHQRTSQLSLSQPLFAGGALQAIRSTDGLMEVARLEKTQAEIDLYAEVAEKFYQILYLRGQRQALSEQNEILRKQIALLEQRARIGRNKATDVFAAQAQGARISAELAGVESDLVESEQRLSYLTGLEKLEVVSDLDVEKMKSLNLREEQLFASPRIKAQELLSANAQREVKIARGSYLPTVDLEGNYYLERAGILRNSDWDASIIAKWEIFSGGSDGAEVKIQRLEAQQLELKLADTKRELARAYQALEQEFTLQQKVILRLRSAVELTEKSYREHQREFAQGLVNNLDVLRSLDESLQVRRAFHKQVFDTQLSWIRLRTLAGLSPEQAAL